MLIAIDPGGVTGVAWRDDEGKIGLFQMEGGGEFYKWLWEKLEDEEGEVTVVVENFSTGGRISRDGLMTVRIIGGVQAMGILGGWKVYLAEPAARNSQKYVVEEEWGIVHRDRHQRDALMHLLAWEVREKRRR